MTEIPDSRKSTPDYLDQENKMCASCSRCHVANIYNPSRTGLCMEKGKVVKFTDKKECWR